MSSQCDQQHVMKGHWRKWIAQNVTKTLEKICCSNGTTKTCWKDIGRNLTLMSYDLTQTQRYQNMGVSESSAADVSQVFCSQISKADCSDKNGDSIRFPNSSIIGCWGSFSKWGPARRRDELSMGWEHHTALQRYIAPRASFPSRATRDCAREISVCADNGRASRCHNVFTILQTGCRRGRKCDRYPATPLHCSTGKCMCQTNWRRSHAQVWPRYSSSTRNGFALANRGGAMRPAGGSIHARIFPRSMRAAFKWQRSPAGGGYGLLLQSKSSNPQMLW